MTRKIRSKFRRQLSISLFLCVCILIIAVVLFGGLMKNQSKPCDTRVDSGTSTVSQVESQETEGVFSIQSGIESRDPESSPKAQETVNSYIDKDRSDNWSTNENVETEVSYMIDVPYLTQQGIYPSGCEVVSATMVLRYWGLSISIQDYINHYLEIEPFYRKNGVLYGPDPNKVFAGDPLDEFSCGCYAPVIEKSLNEILAGKWKAIDTTGTQLDELAKGYITNDIPVIIWASIDMQPTKKGNVWITEDGETVQWITPEHCLVLVGFNQSEYFLNDPYENRGLVRFPKEVVEARFQELGQQSVVIIPE
jgi:uncharacterized protein YvpB